MVVVAVPKKVADDEALANMGLVFVANWTGGLLVVDGAPKHEVELLLPIVNGPVLETPVFVFVVVVLLNVKPILLSDVVDDAGRKVNVAFAAVATADTLVLAFESNVTVVATELDCKLLVALAVIAALLIVGMMLA